jgi:predicted nucleotidyltransferase
MKRARRNSADCWGSVQWPTPRAAEWARLLTKDANVEALVAIGSAARGRARATSDVDLIVVCKDVKKKVPAPLEVDVRWMDHRKLQASVRSGDDVIAWGIAFGAPLYDPEKVWHRLVVEWRDPPVPTSRETVPPGNVCTDGRRLDLRLCRNPCPFERKKTPGKASGVSVFAVQAGAP